MRVRVASTIGLALRLLRRRRALSFLLAVPSHAPPMDRTRRSVPSPCLGFDRGLFHSTLSNHADTPRPTHSRSTRFDIPQTPNAQGPESAAGWRGSGHGLLLPVPRGESRLLILAGGREPAWRVIRHALGSTAHARLGSRGPLDASGADVALSEPVAAGGRLGARQAGRGIRSPTRVPPVAFWDGGGQPLPLWTGRSV